MGPRNVFPPGWTSPVALEGITPPGSFQNMPPTPLRLRQGSFRPGNTEAPKIDTFDESAFVRLNGTIYTPVPNGSSALVLPQSNQLRNFLGFRNASASGGANIYLNFGDVASLNSWIVLVPGQIMLLDVRIPQDNVYAYGDAASAFLAIVVSSTPGMSTS